MPVPVWLPTHLALLGMRVTVDVQLEIITTYSEDGGDDDRDRWRIVIVPAETGRGQGDDHVIELDSITEFCKGNKMTEAAKEKMVSCARLGGFMLGQEANQTARGCPGHEHSVQAGRFESLQG